MPSLRYRLFGAGKLPAMYAEFAADPDTLLVAEGVSIKITARDVRAPGCRISRSVRLHSGAVVASAERLVVTVGSRPAIAVRYPTDQPTNTALRCAVADTGFALTIDLAQAIADASGTVTLEVSTAVPANVVAASPHGEQVLALTTLDRRSLARWC